MVTPDNFVKPQDHFTPMVPTQKNENKRLVANNKRLVENNLITTPGNFVMTPSQENATGNPKDEKL